MLSSLDYIPGEDKLFRRTISKAWAKENRVVGEIRCYSARHEVWYLSRVTGHSSLHGLQLWPQTSQYLYQESNNLIRLMNSFTKSWDSRERKRAAH